MVAHAVGGAKLVFSLMNLGLTIAGFRLAPE